jgi:hypothetical protein
MCDFVTKEKENTHLAEVEKKVILSHFIIRGPA